MAGRVPPAAGVILKRWPPGREVGFPGCSPAHGSLTHTPLMFFLRHIVDHFIETYHSETYLRHIYPSLRYTQEIFPPVIHPRDISLSETHFRYTHVINTSVGKTCVRQTLRGRAP